MLVNVTFSAITFLGHVTTKPISHSRASVSDSSEMNAKQIHKCCRAGEIFRMK